jgi:hypothetical protein
MAATSGEAPMQRTIVVVATVDRNSVLFLRNEGSEFDFFI